MALFQRLLARAGLLRLPVARTTDAAVDPDARTRPLLPRRSVTLAELLEEDRSARADREGALKSAAAGVTADLDQVYAAAGVEDPAHGWTVDRVVDFAAERAGEGREEQRRAVQVQLAIEKVPAEDLFRDAHARDEAVDAYERFLKARVAELRADYDGETERLERELAALRGRLDRLRRERAKLDETWAAWRREKRARERAWVDALTLLLAPDPASGEPAASAVEAIREQWVSVTEEE